MLRLPGLAYASLVTLALLSSKAVAQCPLPDNLDGGPCCTATQPIIPFLPNFKQSSLGICWEGCDVDQVFNYQAGFRDLGSLGLVPPCGEKWVLLRIRVPSGPLQWSGYLRLQYSRTWVETDTTGVRIQVWRFLANGDLRPTASLTGPCPLPPCAPFTNNKVRFTGYVDYASPCLAVPPVTFEHSWMLTHACDSVDHAPGFARAGVFHPDRSYTFVGPSAGFVPGPLQPVAIGGGSSEAVRRRILPVPGTVGVTCEYEEQVSQFLDPLGDLCLCGLAIDPSQWTVSELGVAGACGTTISTPGGPFLPGYLSMGIGGWTNPSQYPGVEQLRWSCGGYDYADPCIGITRSEVFFGVTTFGGYTANQLLSAGVGTLLPSTFVDQSNALRNSAPYLVRMNLPFTSDHFLNLNY